MRSSVPLGYQGTDRVALELGRRAADRLTPENIAAFRTFVERVFERGRSPYAAAWLDAIQQGVRPLRELLLDASDRGQVMRSVISFRAFVPKSERDAVLREIFGSIEGEHPNIE